MKPGPRVVGALKRAGLYLGAAIAAVWLAGCATYPEPPAAPDLTSPAERQSAAAEQRPGLATGFGKPVTDRLQQQSFVRAKSSPAGTDRIYYNDRSGIEAMSPNAYRAEPGQTAAGGLVEWGIKGSMTYLPAYKSGGHRFVVGQAGSPYSIHLKNRSRSRLEIVASVDGLDVIDGKPASFAKRGYIVAPGETLEIKGWRTSHDSVARFEFSSVGASYAHLKHGDARNVGVIGIAVFGEKGVDPWKWMPGEIQTRRSASPFATAP